MPNRSDKFRDISNIDARLNELEREKQQLIALREELLKSKPIPAVSGSFSTKQKKAIFRGLFEERMKIFLTYLSEIDCEERSKRYQRGIWEKFKYHSDVKQN